MDTSHAAPLDWNAQWIRAADNGEAGACSFFRKTFRIIGVEPAQVRISTGSRYELFINAVFAGRGEPRGQSAGQRADTHDVSDLLRPRENVITVRVHRDRTNPDSRAGLLLELRTQSNETLGTDESWRVLPVTAWQSYAPASQMTDTTPPLQEFYDARRDPDGWHEVTFNDTEWKRASARGAPDAGPEHIPNVHPAPMEIPCLPLQIMSVTEGPAAPGEEPHDLMPGLSGAGNPICHCAVTGAEALVSGKGAATFTTRADVAPSILLDFGSEFTARVSLTVVARAGSTLDLGYADTLDAGALSLTGADRMTLREGEQTLAPFGQRRFRYLRIRFGSCPDGMVVRRVLAMAASQD